MQPGSGLKLYIGACEILYPDVTVVGTALVFQRFGAPPVDIPKIWCGTLYEEWWVTESAPEAPSLSATPKRSVPRFEPLVKRTGYKHSLPHPPPSSIGKHLQPHVSNHPECLIRGQCYQNVAKATFITFAVPNLREEDS